MPGAFGTIATGINNLGQIVGRYGVLGSDPDRPNIPRDRGFVRDTDGTITTFDAPYFGSTQPNGISDKGTIAASLSRSAATARPTWASPASASYAHSERLVVGADDTLSNLTKTKAGWKPGPLLSIKQN